MSNEFEPPTYEKYLRATEFARFRYKYGLIVTIIASVLLLILIIYVIVYAKELSVNPFKVVVNKLNVESCTCDNGNIIYIFNEEGVSYTRYPQLPKK